MVTAVLMHVSDQLLEDGEIVFEGSSSCTSSVHAEIAYIYFERVFQLSGSEETDLFSQSVEISKRTITGSL